MPGTTARQRYPIRRHFFQRFLRKLPDGLGTEESANGGGAAISRERLLKTMLEEFGENEELKTLIKSLEDPNKYACRDRSPDSDYGGLVGVGSSSGVSRFPQILE
jgi:hypothetical protein